jgi:hypothetical protein
MIRFDKARQFVAACEARLEQELKFLGGLYLTFPPIPRLDRAQLRHTGGKPCIYGLLRER